MNIYNIYGRKIKNSNWEIKNKLCIKDFSNGIYYLKIQSLNYNTNYNLFENNLEFKSHIKFVIDCAEDLEAKILVFGSPKNR